MVNQVNNCSFSGMFLAETRLKDGKDFCYHQERTIVKLESHIPSPWKPGGEPRLDDSCSHHPFSQSYRSVLL